MPRSTRPLNRTWIYVVVVGAAISVALFFLGRYTVGNRAMSPNDRKSIAVLPFASLSENKSDAYFAEGIQDRRRTQHARDRPPAGCRLHHGRFRPARTGSSSH